MDKIEKKLVENKPLLFSITIILPIYLMAIMPNNKEYEILLLYVNLALFFILLFASIFFYSYLKDKIIENKGIKNVIQSWHSASIIKIRLANNSINNQQRIFVAIAIPLIFFIIIYVVAQNADEAANKVYYDYVGNPFNFRNTWFYWTVSIVVVFLIEFKLFETKK